MTNRILLFVLIAATYWSVAAQCALSQDTGGLRDEIRKLGRGGEDFRIVEILAKTPRASVELLIHDLHPISETRILNGQENPDAEHVLWSIRALRYLTGGKDFCGGTRHHFGSSEEEQNRKYWIYFRYETCASFFAMWPSRGSEYIAPEDTQREIIGKWKLWFTQNGASFDYQPLRNPKPEDWLW